MLKKISIAGALLVAFLMAIHAKPAAAQDSGSKAEAATEVGHAYRLDFTMSELEEGKKINSREYSILNTGNEGEVKIGTRVPVEFKNGELQYIDVGTNIWCRLRDRKDENWLGNDVMLTVRSEMSSIVAPEPNQGLPSAPPVRQSKIDASTIAVVGKPTVVGIVDDPNSKRQFQLEVTVTKLR